MAQALRRVEPMDRSRPLTLSRAPDSEAKALNIRPATADDAAAIAAIYNPFVTGTVVSFEAEPVSAAEMAARVADKQRAHDWLVACEGDALLGYAYYGEYRSRAAYRGTVEASVYVAPDAAGRGVGRALYEALFDSARRKGFGEMIGVVALPNPASDALHAATGFRRIGVIERVGVKFGRAVDTAYWQKSLAG